MSFRDNLQHLRASRNMSQGQLAMLLGVSRQSVTKWESEKSYPEMDKLIKLCEVFDCTLDDLVLGDLTRREEEQNRIPAGPPTDVCGYDEHMRRRAVRLPLGVAVIIAVTGVAYLFPAGVRATVVLLGIAGGLVFLVPSAMEHSSFIKAHPYVEDFYTDQDRERVHAQRGRAIAAGVAIIVAVLAGELLYQMSPVQGLPIGPIETPPLTFAVWLIMHYVMLDARTDVAKYNRKAVRGIEEEDVERAGLDSERSGAMVEGIARSKRRRALYGAIMLIATMVALPLVLEGRLLGLTRHDANMLAVLTWALAGMLCGVMALVARFLGR